jgi:hypothetical protein
MTVGELRKVAARGAGAAASDSRTEPARAVRSTRPLIRGPAEPARQSPSARKEGSCRRGANDSVGHSYGVDATTSGTSSLAPLSPRSRSRSSLGMRFNGLDRCPRGNTSLGCLPPQNLRRKPPSSRTSSLGTQKVRSQPPWTARSPEPAPWYGADTQGSTKASRGTQKARSPVSGGHDAPPGRSG